MKKCIASIIFILSMFSGYSQPFRVYFTDKGDSVIDREHVALSDKALQRRVAHNIELDERDLPVYIHYINQIREIGAEIKAKSRWFNYVLVEGVSLKEVKALPFVREVESPVIYRSSLASESLAGESRIEYGLASGQMEMVRGNVLHQMGYLGEGMSIAVIDGGFTGTESSSVFDNLWQNNRISGMYNFKDGDTNVFQDGSHGSKVLSILGGYIDNIYSGSAPRANYWLLKSEVESSELAIEMDYWLMAAEYADSVGADLITSSLGYNQFDDGNGNISYSELDGNTSLVTRAADMAAAKGILVIVSAGNEGNSPWQHITAPADADSALAVGAVDRDGEYAYFSGTGPTADGRIKPDVVAQGAGTAFASGDNVYTGNGTSFSCPIISGLAACLWQVNPERSNMEIYKAIINSSNRQYNPDNKHGYGIPNFESGFYQIGVHEALQTAMIKIYPNPVPAAENKLKISFGFPTEIPVSLSIYDLSGRELSKQNIISGRSVIQIDFPFDNGVYFLRFNMGANIFTYKILK